MNSSYDWSQYNNQRNKQAIKINDYNIRSNTNFFELGHYNHVRDIYALSLLLMGKRRGKIKVLDFGGNLIVHANLVNKIKINRLFFYIFNPHMKDLKKKLSFKYKILSNIKLLLNKKFDFLYFGSSLQYIRSFEKIKKLNFITKSEYILITHTPISLGSKKSFLSKQINHKGLYQTIYSYNFIHKKILKNKYDLIFKSINDQKYTGLKKNNKKIYSTNLLFKKK